MSLRRQRRSQPQQATEIEWGNPIARGLSFAAVPVTGGRLTISPLFVDCVTGEFGVGAGNNSLVVAPHGGGKSRQHDGARAGLAVNVSTIKVEWPISALRGGSMVNEGTLLALASTATQIDGSVYVIGGTTDAVSTGNGVTLHIDSNSSVGRGNIIGGNCNGSRNISPTALLGNPFDNRLHFFGFSFTGDGTDGIWFAEGNGTTWTGGNTFGSATQTNRKARIFNTGTDVIGRRDSNVALFLMWDRALSVYEYRALYENPWQLFAGVPERTRVRAPAALAPVLSAATVTSITATGATPRVTVTI